MEELTKCPVCKKETSALLLECEDHTVSHETFRIVKCLECGFRFTNPRPTESDIGKYYESDEYISHSNANQGVVNTIYQIVRNYTIKQKVKLINRLIPASAVHRRILDYGSGTGEFLNACKKDGWETTGIEPSPRARKYAEKNYCLKISPPDFLSELSNESYNIITLWHVLEHVHYLDKTIIRLRELLASESYLIIAVPNCESRDAERYGKYWAAWDVPRHLYHFTASNIEQLFSSHGFILQDTLPMKFDSYYVSMLSEKYKSGNTHFFNGIISGWRSNSFAEKNKNKYSSQIYILKKSSNAYN